MDITRVYSAPVEVGGQWVYFTENGGPETPWHLIDEDQSATAVALRTALASFTGDTSLTADDLLAEEEAERQSIVDAANQLAIDNVNAELQAESIAYTVTTTEELAEARAFLQVRTQTNLATSFETRLNP